METQDEKTSQEAKIQQSKNASQKKDEKVNIKILPVDERSGI